MLSPSMPFAMDLPASPSQTQARLNDTASMSSRLNERKMSNGSLRSSSSFVNTNLGSIAEDNTAAGGFPEPTQRKWQES